MINRTKLHNGLEIITQNDPNAKTLTLSFTVKAGSYNEDNSNYGIAHFTEHMLFKGTTTMTSEQISQSIEGIGGILNAETSFEHTKFYCTIPSDQWQIGLKVLSDMIWFNTLPEDEFDKEKQVVLEELKMYNDDPHSKIMDLLLEYTHPNYPNRQRIGGTLESVKNINRNQMKLFIDKFYIPSNIVVIATGNVNHEELVKYVDIYCSEIEIENKQIKKEDIFVPDKLNNQDIVEKKDVVQSHLAWGIFGPAPSEQEYSVAEIVCGILGGNSSSRLYQIVREQKGLCYTIDMDIEIISDGCLLVGYVGLDENNIEEVKKVLFEQFNKLKNELISDDELKRIKSYLKGSLMIILEKTSSQNNFITNGIINNTDINWENYFNAFDNVTKENVKDFANKYFKNDNICFVQIIPK